MATTIVKTDELSIQEAKQNFLDMPEVKAVTELKKTADKLIKDIDKISKHQDETTKSVLDAYKSQLLVCQNLSQDQTLPAEKREKYFDLSMEITIYIKELKDKDDKRKKTEKTVKFVLLGGTVVISIPFLVKLAGNVIKTFKK